MITYDDRSLIDTINNVLKEVICVFIQFTTLFVNFIIKNVKLSY